MNRLGVSKRKHTTFARQIADLTAGWNTRISVAYVATFDLQKFVADNFILKLPNVDCLAMNMTLVQVDTQATNLLHSAIEAEETLKAIVDPPCSYKPDPTEDDLDLQPYNHEDDEDMHYERDRATLLWEGFGIASEKAFENDIY
jgi:hypothetical protein